MRTNAVMAAALLAACGGDRSDASPAADATIADTVTASQAAADSSEIKACDLSTEADLKRITGLELSPGRTTNDYLGVSQCKWDRADGKEGVSISLHRRGNIGNYRNLPGSKPVRLLGDEAVWNATVNQLAVRKGESVMSISFLSSTEQLEWAKQVATIALERFGR